MNHLRKRHGLLLHAQLIAETGGSEGVRDEGLLDAALDAPHAGFAGQEFFPSVEAKAARLAFGLIRNHAFVDGNKRIGVPRLEDVGEFMDEFVTRSEPHDDPSDPAPLSPDSKDDYLIALALDSRADALVFGDSDLHGLDVLGLRVFTPRELLDRYLLDQDV